MLDQWIEAIEQSLSRNKAERQARRANGTAQTGSSKRVSVRVSQSAELTDINTDRMTRPDRVRRVLMRKAASTQGSPTARQRNAVALAKGEAEEGKQTIRPRKARLSGQPWAFASRGVGEGNAQMSRKAG